MPAAVHADGGLMGAISSTLGGEGAYFFGAGGEVSEFGGGIGGGIGGGSLSQGSVGLGGGTGGGMPPVGPTCITGTPSHLLAA